MAGVKLHGIEKVFGNTTAVTATDLDVHDGEFLVLVGPSGCGKTTTLRMIAGLETPTSGKIFIGERDVTKLEPKDRDIAMVFQSYALYPHKNVFENMAFGLRLRKRPKDEINGLVRKTADMLGISEYLERFPKQLSGGQRQRVALGRAIVRQPQVFLMDEPLSNLDAKLRVQTRAELIKLHQRLKTTVIYVTHDQTEAMTMGSRIVVMKDGEVQQIGSPKEVYGKPANRFVAGFLGSPPMNFLKGIVATVGNKLQFRSQAMIIDFPVPSTSIETNEVFMGIRPESLNRVGQQFAPSRSINCTVEVVEHIGSEAIIYAKIPSGEELIIHQNGFEEAPLVGAEIKVWPGQGNIHLFDAENGKRLITAAVTNGVIEQII